MRSSQEIAQSWWDQAQAISPPARFRLLPMLAIVMKSNGEWSYWYYKKPLLTKPKPLTIEEFVQHLTEVRAQENEV